MTMTMRTTTTMTITMGATGRASQAALGRALRSTTLTVTWRREKSQVSFSTNIDGWSSLLTSWHRLPLVPFRVPLARIERSSIKSTMIWIRNSSTGPSTQIWSSTFLWTFSQYGWLKITASKSVSLLAPSSWYSALYWGLLLPLLMYGYGSLDISFAWVLKPTLRIRSRNLPVTGLETKREAWLLQLV